MTRPVRETYDHLINEGLTPIRRWGQPEDVANAVFFLSCDDSSYITGQVLAALGEGST